MTGSIIAVVGDTHFGSTLAPASPTYKLHTARKEEAAEQTANKLQLDLYEKWQDYWRYVFNLAGIKGRSRKHRLILIHLGDVIDGNHHDTHQITPEVADQIALANNLMGEVHKLADVRIGIQGTEVHTGVNGEDEEGFYRDNNYQYIAHQLTIEIDGVLLDLAHHGRVPGRKWSSGASSLASAVALDYQQAGIRAPDFIFRGHNHQLDDSGERLRKTRAVSCPCWQHRTGHGYKVSTSKLADIGGIVVNCGVLDFSHARYEFPSDGEVIRI